MQKKRGKNKDEFKDNRLHSKGVSQSMKTDIKIPIDGKKDGLNDTLYEEEDSVRFSSFKGADDSA